jgi:hypothetical protein
MAIVASARPPLIGAFVRRIALARTLIELAKQLNPRAPVICVGNLRLH